MKKFSITEEVIYHNNCGGDKGIVDLQTNNDGYSNFRCRNCGLEGNISKLFKELIVRNPCPICKHEMIWHPFCRNNFQIQKQICLIVQFLKKIIRKNCTIR